MPLAELIGGLAAFLTTASFLPQAAKVLRTRETGAISLIICRVTMPVGWKLVTMASLSP